MKQLRINSEWKKVDYYNQIDDETFKDLIEIEEVDEYELIDDAPISERPQKKRKKMVKASKSKRVCEEISIPNVSAEEWKKFGSIPDSILSAISQMGFLQPSNIQKAIIPNIINHKKNGSGKTLAFLVPIVTDILNDTERKNGLKCLIVTPTRELALQIKAHTLALTKFTTLKVVTLVGGMSVHKQERLLKRNPDIVIATPGRLRDLIAQPIIVKPSEKKNTDNKTISKEIQNTNKLTNNSVENSLEKCTTKKYLIDFRSLRYFVMDEADKLINAGHWRDLKAVLIHIKRLWVFHSLPPVVQCFIISATLSSPIQRYKNSLKIQDTSSDTKTHPQKRKKNPFEDSSHIPLITKFKRLFSSLPFTLTKSRVKKEISTKGQRPKRSIQNVEFLIVDLASKEQTVPTLTELRIDCRHDGDKELMLYYLLVIYMPIHFQHNIPKSCQQSVKILVFCNSIDCVRRLSSLFKLLLCGGNSNKNNKMQNSQTTLNQVQFYKNSVYSISRIHASMSQRDRLKCMDKFREVPTGNSDRLQISVMFCTDLAARGIDLVGLDCVVHYELSSTFEGFIHRCGRTARAGRAGLSVALLTDPDEKTLKALSKPKPNTGQQPRASSKFKEIKYGKQDTKNHNFFPFNETFKYAQYCKERGKKLADITNIEIPHVKLVDILKERLNLAKDIETVEYRMAKGNRQNNWTQRVKTAFGIMEDDDENDMSTNAPHIKSENNRTLYLLKKRFNMLLRTPFPSHISHLINTGNISKESLSFVSAKYPTMNRIVV